MRSSYVFDSYALLALLENETGADLVAGIIQDQEADIFISMINLGEVYYLLLRRSGIEMAEKVMESVALDDSITVADASWERIKTAASVKAGGGLSYADAFAVTLAKELKAPLLTGDPEIIARADNSGIEVIAVETS